MSRLFACAAIALMACADPTAISDAGLDAVALDASADAGGDACMPAADVETLLRFRADLARAGCEARTCRPWSVEWQDVETCARLDSFEWRIAAGSIRAYVRDVELRMRAFDPIAAAECLDAIRACTCPLEAIAAGPGYACDRAFPLRCGRAAEGERCLHGDCEDALYCLEPAGGTCHGRCRARIAPGGTCEYHTYCAPVAGGGTLPFCSGPAGEAATCRSAEVSAVPAGLGELCGAVRPGDEVVRLVACADGLVCATLAIDVERYERRCVERGDAPAGASCAHAYGCGEGLFCGVDGICAEPERPVPVAEGAGCELGGACDRQHGTVCIDGRCAAAGALGQPCERLGFPELDCDPPLRCDRSTPTCQPRLPVGGGCEADSDCESWCCDVGAEEGSVCFAPEHCADIDAVTCPDPG